MKPHLLRHRPLNAKAQQGVQGHDERDGRQAHRAAGAQQGLGAVQRLRVACHGTDA